MLGLQGHGPGGMALGTLGGAPGWTPGSELAGGDGRPAAGEGCTPGKAPAEPPVPSHPNAHVQSRLLRSTLGNSCIGYPAGPVGGVESGSVLVSLSP